MCQLSRGSNRIQIRILAEARIQIRILRAINSAKRFPPISKTDLEIPYVLIGFVELVENQVNSKINPETALRIAEPSIFGNRRKRKRLTITQADDKSSVTLFKSTPIPLFFPAFKDRYLCYPKDDSRFFAIHLIFDARHDADEKIEGFRVSFRDRRIFEILRT